MHHNTRYTQSRLYQSRISANFSRIPERKICNRMSCRNSIRIDALSCDVPAPDGSFLGISVIPRLGLGLAALGRPGYINLGHHDHLADKTEKGMREQCAVVLDEAHKLGIRYFDAARSYGKAEDFLSSWLQSRGHSKAPEGGPDSILVGSKWGYTYTANWNIDMGGQPHEVKEHSASNLVKQSAESEALLGSHLHLYQIHSATLDSGVLESEEVLHELRKLKLRLGWRLGLSCSGVKQAETIRMAMTKQMPDGSPLFDSVQVTWNIMEQSAGPALLEARAAGMDIIVKEGMANGRLLQGTHLEALQKVAMKYQLSPDAVALAVIMRQPFMPMVLSGAATIQHLRSNAHALKLAPLLSEFDVESLMQHSRVEPKLYWEERSEMAWN